MTLQDWDILALKKESHRRLQKKETTKLRIPNLHAIYVVRNDIHLIYVEVRMPINTISLRVQAIVINARNKDIKHMNVEPRLS